MNFRPYHNPENIDESKVPDGWRFRYADEKYSCNSMWRSITGKWCMSFANYGNLTYIVLVNS